MNVTHLKAPSIILLLNQNDASMVASGMLGLKGCAVYVSKTAEDCLSLLDRPDTTIDAVLIREELAPDRDIVLIRNIRKVSPDILVIVMSDIMKEELKYEEHGIDEIVATPISAENLADKILLFLARKELKKLKEEQLETL